MNKGALQALKVVLWVVCVCHILLGGTIMLGQSFQERAAALYGAQVAWTPEFVYILKPLGAFMLVLGIVGIAAALDPVRYRVLGYGFVGLLVIRVIQRVIFQGDILDAFGISTGRNLVNAGFFLVVAVILLVLLQLGTKRTADVVA
ncbi:MAG: hypothetical protein ACYSU7_04460 [Planctomycetota bacterium]